VVIAMDDGAFVLLAHLRQGSLTVQVGDRVAVGDAVGSCGNSGNSTEPHVHLQATDTTDWARTKALPILFATDNGPSLPGESEIIVSGA
jgi:murein DD-endopeptidase MepM/ murein hydrolase activator NlpD